MIRCKSLSRDLADIPEVGINSNADAMCKGCKMVLQGTDRAYRALKRKVVAE